MNQWVTPRKSRAGSNLVDAGRYVVRDRDQRWSWSTPKPDVFAGGEATLKGCGVGVARLPGYSWPPTWTSGFVRNVGSTRGRPHHRAAGPVGGQARCRPMVIGWGGGPVAVVGVTTHQGGRESRPQGQGGQQAGSTDTGVPGGRR